MKILLSNTKNRLLNLSFFIGMVLSAYAMASQAVFEEFTYIGKDEMFAKPLAQDQFRKPSH